MATDDYRKTVAVTVNERPRERAQPALAALTRRPPEGNDGNAPGTGRSQPQIAGGGDDAITEQIGILSDTAKPISERTEALTTLQAAAFMGAKFDPYRAAYRDALRRVATDIDPHLREQALEVLALNNDDYARALLLDGLSEKLEPLVSKAKAVQLLAQDDHGTALAAANRILDEADDPTAQQEAVRVLATDPGSESRLLDLYKDRETESALRIASATALHALNSSKFELEARRIVEDENEDPDVRASSLGALAVIPKYASTKNDPSFVGKVKEIQKSIGDGPLKASTDRYLSDR